MWIEEIFINDFGVWHQLRLDGLQPGLNLIRGPNEAGKTTILEFIRSVFVGFAKRTGRLNPYEPANRAMRCGWFHMRTSSGEQLRFERVEKQGCRNGVLTIVDEHGSRMEGSGIVGLAEGFDTAVFDTLLAFDLDRMRQMDHKALRAKIVATALGSFDTNPLDVIKSVDERLKVLAKRSRGNEPSFPLLQQQIKDIDKQLKSAARLTDAYEDLRKQSEAVAQRLHHISRRMEELEFALANLDTTLRCEDLWKNLLQLDGEIARLQDAEHFPGDGMLRLERALERERAISDNLAAAQEALGQASHQFDSLAPDPNIAANMDLIGRLSQRAAEMSGLPEAIKESSAEVEQAASSLQEQLSALRIKMSREELSAWRLSPETEQEILSLSQTCATRAEKIRAIEMRLEDVSEQMERSRDRIRAAQQEIASVEPLAAAYLDWESRRKLQTCLDAARAMRHLQERLSDKNAVLRNLLQERQQLADRLNNLNTKPRKRFDLLLATRVLGVVAGSGIASYVLWRLAEVSPHLAVGTGICLVGSAAVLAAWRFRKQRLRALEAAQQREMVLQAMGRYRQEIIEHDSQRRAMTARLAAFREEAHEAAREVLEDPHASPQTVADALQRADEAEQPFRRLTAMREELKEMARRLGAEQRLKSQVAENRRRAEHEYTETRNMLNERCDQEALPPDIPPASVPEVLRRVQDLAERARQIPRAEEQLARMQKDWAAFSSEVEELAQAIGHTRVDGASPISAVEGWVQLVREARDMQARRDACAEQLGHHLSRVAALSLKAREAQADIEAVLRAAGMADEQSFREQGRRCEERLGLVQKRQVLLDNLLTAADYEDAAELRTFLHNCDWELIRQDRKTLQAETETLRKEARELAGREGRLQQEIETLESAEETERLSTEKERLLAQVDDVVKEWTQLRLASHLLEKTLRMYEMDKQPRVLARSSEIFKEITGGSFSRVLFPLDEDRIKVERPDGTRLDEAALSRGTLEQLYLAVRLAYLEVYRPRDAALPLLMDDILVNFDAERAKSTARILEQFSEEMGLQILFFTCHAHVADLFSRNVVEVQLGSQSIRQEGTYQETVPGAGWLG
jgi:uncharacterized protein YhaN